MSQPFTNRLMLTSVALMSDRHLSIVRSGEDDAWYPETRLQTLEALELLRTYGWGVPTEEQDGRNVAEAVGRWVSDARKSKDDEGPLAAWIVCLLDLASELCKLIPDESAVQFLHEQMREARIERDGPSPRER
jgi:hypothetical protein